jgi:hypothetical protein
VSRRSSITGFSDAIWMKFYGVVALASRTRYYVQRNGAAVAEPVSIVGRPRKIN